MGKVRITRDDKIEFRKTDNGAQKYRWLQLGIVIDFLFTLSVSLLNIYSKYLSAFEYYVILYILLVFVVIGAELIGTYFGALEEYVINKQRKKIIDYIDS